MIPLQTKFIIMRTIFLVLSLMFTLASCGEDASSFDAASLKAQRLANPATQAERDKNQILDYAIQHQIPVKASPSGLYYHIAEPGTGEAFAKESVATLHYTVRRLHDGFETMSTRKNNKPYEYMLGNNLIEGFKEAIPMLKQGGKGTFLIPSALAHGPRGAGNYYPPNTVLIYEVEVIQLEKKENQDQRQNAKDQKLIEAYLAKKELKMQQTPSGIHYRIEKEGSGTPPGLDAKVKIKYTLSFLDDYALRNDAVENLALDNAMAFWQQTISLLKKGGTGKFVIPSHLAFGNREVGNIPANSVLVLDCELLEIE